MARDATNPYDFLQLFEGKDQVEIQDTMKRVLKILAEEKQERNDNMSRGLVDAMRGTMGTKEWYEANNPTPQTIPDPSPEIDQLSARLEGLLAHPSKNQKEIKETQKQLDGLWEKHDQFQKEKSAIDAAARKSQNSEQIQKASAELDALNREAEGLFKHPSANGARINELSKIITQKADELKRLEEE